ncbi:deoxynucleoside kinase-like [Homalodisca vitripennis]|uniref:deoxynucleoside kinase-like n=1 Tax=Homalodisca vitripennis TaxID=197043 RepID=UPI001EEC41C6|nr:deoxynucleoside kinase-like [Homalodisca vitripennis]
MFNKYPRIATACTPSTTDCRMIIILEGNIAAGKTTFLDLLVHNLPECSQCWMNVIPEPVTDWQNFDGVNILDMYYSDRKRWAMAFQLNAYNTLKNYETSTHHLTRDERQIVIMDRSTFSIKHVFNNIASEYMTAFETKVLKDVLEKIPSMFSSREKDDVVTVYLRTPVEECHRRLKRRGRKEEMGVDVEYLTKIHELYEQHIYDKAYGRLLVVDSFDTHDFKKTPIEFVDSSGRKRQRNLVNLIYDIYTSGTTHVMDVRTNDD